MGAEPDIGGPWTTAVTTGCVGSRAHTVRTAHVSRSRSTGKMYGPATPGVADPYSSSRLRIGPGLSVAYRRWAARKIYATALARSPGSLDATACPPVALDI